MFGVYRIQNILQPPGTKSRNIKTFRRSFGLALLITESEETSLLHYDAILFDSDGTLIDSAPGILHTVEEVFLAVGVDTAQLDLRRYL